MSIGFEESVATEDLQTSQFLAAAAAAKQQQELLHQKQLQHQSSEPLKIPLPKTGNQSTSFKAGRNTSRSTGSTGNVATTATTSGSTAAGAINCVSTSNSSLGPKEGGGFNTDKFRGDSPQIFSIESSRVLGETDSKVVDYSGAFGTGYREASAAAAAEEKLAAGEGTDCQSEFDSDDGDGDNNSNSPFYSSDIDSDTSTDPPLLWNFADYFATIPGNDWCARIPQCFIEDEFNLFELPDVFRCPLTLTDERKNISEGEDDYTFDDLIDFITIEDLTEDPIPKISREMLDDSVKLYKLIHQRFIMTKSGLQAMWERFDQQTFGTCPRYYCHDQALLPLGPSALPGRECARVYCLNCQDVYLPHTPKHAKMDGVPFGPTFPHFFTRTLLYANELKATENRKGSHDWQVFVPKIYGFKIHKGIGNDSGIRSERPRDFK